jgi:hypothetical protein
MGLFQQPVSFAHFNPKNVSLKIAYKENFLRSLLTLMLAMGALFFPATTIHAQVQVKLTHQVTAKVSVQGNNYVKAREKAVSLAFQSALEKALRNFMGDQKFRDNQKDFAEVLAQADLYVQSYRFIEAVDDPVGKTSEVIMEVTLFPNALGNSLGHTGLVTVPGSMKHVVLLISETSITSGEEGGFWDVMPISEAALVQNLTEAGVNVVLRDPIRDNVSEEMVLNAVKGNVNDAIQIGLKVGADIVILGNAMSKKLESQSVSGEYTIQTNISVRVISALKSEVIAAKSDFATARNEDLLAGELEAFGVVSGKLSDFLLSSLNRHWEAPSASQNVPRVSPPSVASPLPLEDL